MAARIVPTPQPFTSLGLTAAYTGPTVDGDSIMNNGARLLHVTNGSGSSINVTVNLGRTIDGQAIAAKVHAIAAGASKFIGPFGVNYSQPTGEVLVDYSAITTVTRAVFEYVKP
jgi:hypothetical protein